MEKQGGVWFRAVLLLAALNCALAEDGYFAAGGTLELRPKQTTGITSILWKHNGNLVAESLNGELTYYGSFKDRTKLDKTTGLLEIKNTGEADAGEYSVEINNVVQGTNYQVKMINKVPKPVVWVRPLTCNGDSTNCTLICEGDTAGAEPVSYSWKKGAEDWKESGQDMNITKTMTDVETFTCKMKNPVSEQESEPKDNPFYMAAQTGSSNGGTVAGVLTPILLILAGVLVFFLIKKGIIPKFWIKRDGQSNRTEASPSGDNEAAPLDKKAAGGQEGK